MLQYAAQCLEGFFVCEYTQAGKVKQKTNSVCGRPDYISLLYSFPIIAPLFLRGESYAGIYVPTLVNTIRVMNQNSSADRINLKGFMVYKPVIN